MVAEFAHFNVSSSYNVAENLDVQERSGFFFFWGGGLFCLCPHLVKASDIKKRGCGERRDVGVPVLFLRIISCLKGQQKEKQKELK